MTNEWIQLALILATSLVIAVMSRYIILHTFQWTLKKKNLLPSAYSLTRYFFPAFGLLIFVFATGTLLHLFEVELIVGAELKKFYYFSLAILVTWNAAKFFDVGCTMLIHQYDTTVADNLAARRMQTQLQFIERIALIFIWFIGIGLALTTIDSVRRIGGGLLASAGIVSVIVGFAAQKSISNLLAGFQIAFTQPLRIDDVVVVEGEWGKIEEISLTYIVICIWDQRRLIVPITYFTEQPFQNWTRITSDLLAPVYIYTDYSVPVEDLRHELARILQTTDLWDKKVNVVQVTDSKESTIEIRALISAEDSGKAWDLRCLVREKLIQYLQKNYPQALPRIRLETTPLASAQRP